MNTHLEIKGDEKALYVHVNDADMVVDSSHPMYVELRLVIDDIIASAARNVRNSVAGTLTFDDLIHANKKRLKKLEEYQRHQAGE